MSKHFLEGGDSESMAFHVPANDPRHPFNVLLEMAQSGETFKLTTKDAVYEGCTVTHVNGIEVRTVEDYQKATIAAHMEGNFHMLTTRIPKPFDLVDHLKEKMKASISYGSMLEDDIVTNERLTQRAITQAVRNPFQAGGVMFARMTRVPLHWFAEWTLSFEEPDSTVGPTKGIIADAPVTKHSVSEAIDEFLSRKET